MNTSYPGSNNNAVLPTSQLHAVVNNEVGANTPVWNLLEVNYYVWVDIDPRRTRTAKLYQISEVDGKGGLKPIAMNAIHKSSPTWLRIYSQVLNMTEGYHKYRIDFVDTVTNSSFYLYFAYIIQNDNPEKPYVYMNNPKPDECEDEWVDRRFF